ncbi:MAG: ACP S-malonyltransferase [bacterium]
MSKTVLLFPGQGSQYVGMARELYDDSAEVRALYELASDEIGADIAKVSFEGPADQLKQTRFTQPAILLHSLAVLTHLGDSLPAFDYAAGHSLGEYGALAVTGALSYENAVRAVVKRAALMEEACRARPSTMAAIIGLDGSQVEHLCAEASAVGVVVAANFNSERQVVISGEPSAVRKAVELAKETGARRAVMLEVGGAFHSPLMQSACEPLQQFLSGLSFNRPSQPVVANVTAQPVDEVGAIPELLVRQLTAPVRWAETMSFLADNDVHQVVELGPGKVLSALAKRDLRPGEMFNLDTLADVEAFQAVSV